MTHLNDLKQFRPDSYARNLVLRTPNVEIIVVCWLPGQCSPAHGHGPSDAIQVILEGEMSYTNYYADGKVVSGIWRTGEIGHVPVGVEHRIANFSDQPLVTLHIYAPPLARDLHQFDLGYHNDVAVEELQVSDDVIHYIKAAAPFFPDVSHYDI